MGALIGRTLDGRYEVRVRLGAGSTGEVYQGQDVRLDRPVAIKVLRQSVASPEWRRRFEREARALTALAHPNVVPFTAFGIDGEAPYLVMELLQGKTLATVLDEGAVTPARALDIVRQMLRGLAAGHDQAIAHRDLKPANVFLQARPDRGDHVRLLDFGVAQLVDGVSAPSSYMSPEQAKGERVDTRADIYAAGAILFELLAGRPPYTADTPEGLIQALVSEPVPSLAKVRPELSIARVVQPVIDRAMAKKPADRYSKALWMLSALEAVGGASSVAAADEEPAPTLKDLPPVSASEAQEPPVLRQLSSERSAPEVGPRRWRTAIALVVVTASVAAGVTFLRRGRGPLVETAKPIPVQVPAPSPPAPAQPPSPPTAVATQTPPQPASAVAPGKRARDPWQEAVPETLKPLRDSLEHAAHLNEGALGPAYAFARQNAGDPRPWLLIAHAYAQLNWLTDSVDRYQRAYRADPTSRGDPHMLDDLLKAAAHRVAGRRAAGVIRDIYGAEALPALEKAIARGTSDEDGNERLDHLRDSLEQ